VAITTDIASNTHLLDQAGSTDQVLSSCGVLHDLVLRAVDKAAKVWLDTLAAHVEAYPVLYESHQVPKVEVTLGRESWVSVELFFARNLHCFHLKLRSEFHQFVDFILDLKNVLCRNRLLATWAAHESKRDP